MLHGLDLSYLSLQGKLPDGLFEFLVSLLNFKLGGNPRLDISNLPEFLASEFEDLRILKELTGMALGLRGRLGALAFVPSLTEVSLANNRFEGGLDAIAVLTRLVSLDLSANAVGGTLEPLAELGRRGLCRQVLDEDLVALHVARGVLGGRGGRHGCGG